jgi:kynureninase
MLLEITDTTAFSSVIPSLPMTALNLSTAMHLATAQALDAADALRGLRGLFELPQGVIYLDGNSLGVLPHTAAARLAQVVQQDWGVGFIRSWNAAGWMCHAAPFVLTPGYTPAKGIARYLCGTPPVLSLAALKYGVDTLLADRFITLVAQRCAGYGLKLVTPRQHAQRRSQVSYAKKDNGYAIMQALIARCVIGDFCAGTPGATRTEDVDILRFGFTPLYVGFADVWHAAEHMHQVLARANGSAANLTHNRP